MKNFSQFFESKSEWISVDDNTPVSSKGYDMSDMVYVKLNNSPTQAVAQYNPNDGKWYLMDQYRTDVTKNVTEWMKIK